MDDILVIFERPYHLQEFAEYMNKQYLYARFSIEAEKKGLLPFEGIKICKGNETFVTSAFYTSFSLVFLLRISFFKVSHET